MDPIRWLAVSAALADLFETENLDGDAVELAFRTQGLEIGPIPTEAQIEAEERARSIIPVALIFDAIRESGEVVTVKESWGAPPFDAIAVDAIEGILEGLVED